MQQFFKFPNAGTRNCIQIYITVDNNLTTHTEMSQRHIFLLQLGIGIVGFDVPRHFIGDFTGQITQPRIVVVVISGMQLTIA